MAIEENDLDIDVGQCLRMLRINKGLSIRVLAELSDLNVNTLSLIENGRTSPSVSTLQQLARGLEVPIKAFFEKGQPEKHIVFQKSDKRPRAVFSHGMLDNMGEGLGSIEFEPFIVTLQPISNSGENSIVHAGLEFVYCLDGQVNYSIDNEIYLLEVGDSILFEAHLPHGWMNPGRQPARVLLVISRFDKRDQPIKKHFALNE
ncbi:MAG: cupin domain-containing protein [Anaerolineales bacterium]|nr:cupin domain-containing protein [Anaerolineales bacterium]